MTFSIIFPYYDTVSEGRGFGRGDRVLRYGLRRRIKEKQGWEKKGLTIDEHVYSEMAHSSL